MRKIKLSLIMSLAIVAGPMAAAAEMPATAPLASRDVKLAEEHYRAGATAYEAGRYEVALIEFEASYKLHPDDDQLHNLSLVCEKLGKIKEAIGYEQQYLAARPHLEQAEADQVQGRLDRLKLGLVARRGASTEPSAKPPNAIDAAPAAQPAVVVAQTAPAGSVAVPRSDKPRPLLEPSR